MEFKLRLQTKNVEYKALKDFIFKPYGASSKTTVKQLKELFITIGFSEKRSLILARFITEP